MKNFPACINQAGKCAKSICNTKNYKNSKIFKKVVDKIFVPVYTNEVGWENNRTNGVLAQLGEHLPYKQRVIGSSPIGSISNESWFIWRDSSVG